MPWNYDKGFKAIPTDPLRWKWQIEVDHTIVQTVALIKNSEFEKYITWSTLHPTSLLIGSIIHGSYFNVLLQSKMREEDWEMIKISMIKMSNSYKNLMVCSYCHYFRCWSFHWSDPVAVFVMLSFSSSAVYRSTKPLFDFTKPQYDIINLLPIYCHYKNVFSSKLFLSYKVDHEILAKITKPSKMLEWTLSYASSLCEMSHSFGHQYISWLGICCMLLLQSEWA